VPCGGPSWANVVVVTDESASLFVVRQALFVPAVSRTRFRIFPKPEASWSDNDVRHSWIASGTDEGLGSWGNSEIVLPCVGSEIGIDVDISTRMGRDLAYRRTLTCVR
jgi:hypothetical protein